MANDTQSATTLLKYQVDTGSVTTALNANAQISASYKDVQKAAADVGLTAEEFAARAGIKITDLASKTTSAANETVQSQVKVAEAYDQVAASATNAADAQTASASSGGGVSIQQVGSRIAGVGSIIGGVGGEAARDVSQVVQMTAAFGAAGLAAGLVTLAYTAVTEESKKTADALAASAKAYEDVAFQALTTSRKQLEAERDALTLRVQLAQKFVQIADDNIQKLFETGDLTKAFGGELDGLNQASADANKRLSEATDQLNAYNLVLADSTAGYTDVTDLLNQLADAQESANKQLAEYNAQIKDQITGYEDLITKEVELRQDIFDIGQVIQQLREDATAKETDALTDRNQKIADIEADAGAKRAEIIQNALDLIAKIERDAGRAEGNAIGNRDANALRLAREKETDALADAKKAGDKQQTQITTQLAKQEATVRTSYDKQVRQIETALSQQTQIQNRKLQQDYANLVNVTNAEIGVAINGSSGLYRIHAGMWSDLGLLAFQGVYNILSQVGNLVSNVTAIQTSAYPIKFPTGGGGGGNPNGIYSRAQIDAIVHQNLSNLIGLRQGS